MSTPFDTTLIDLPPAVAEASERFAEALARRTAVRGELAAKADELKAAQRADEHAAREAVAAGKQPPAATAAKIAEAHDRATRAVPAAEQNVRAAEDVYLRAVLDRFDELKATVDDRRQALREEAQHALDALTGTLRELVALDDLDRELDRPSLQGRHRMFKPVRVTRRKDPADEIVAPIRARLGMYDPGNRFVTGRRAA